MGYFRRSKWLVTTCSSLLLFVVTETRADISAREAAVEAEKARLSKTILWDGQEVKVHPSRVIVKFKNSSSRKSHPRSTRMRQLGDDNERYLIHHPPELSVETVLEHYQTDPNVEYVEPDFIREPSAIPNDPLWSQQWDMVKINAPQAWNTQTDASDIVVGILDSGIDFNHPDLFDNLWTSSEDGSHGFDCELQRSGGEDSWGHGTLLAGIIGARGNNNIGIAGVSWKVKLLSLRAGGMFFYTSSIVNCLDHAIRLKRSGVNLRVINQSYGGLGYSIDEHNALLRAANEGILIVTSAYNRQSNEDLVPYYPPNYNDIPGLITIMSTTQDDRRHFYSDWGLATVDLAAPVPPTTTTQIGEPDSICWYCSPSGYATPESYLGNSLASPYVSGTAAGLFHRNPALTPAQARDIILDFQSYDALTDTEASQNSTGGRLNVGKVMANPMITQPRVNNFPTYTNVSNPRVASGATVQFVATANDADGDTLRFSPFLVNSGPGGCAVRSGVLGRMLARVFPESVPNGGTFTAPRLAYPGVTNYVVSVSDRRGGNDSIVSYVDVGPSPTPGSPPTATLSVTPLSGPGNIPLNATVNGSDPNDGDVIWGFSYALSDGQMFWRDGIAINQSMNTNPLSPPAGVYRVRARAIDEELHITETNSVVVRLGGMIGEPPIASAVLDKRDGELPLVVTIDASGSRDPDGTLTNVGGYCGSSQLTPLGGNRFTCTYLEPGPYLGYIWVKDNSGYADTLPFFVTARVPPAPDTQAPTVSLTSPQSGATVSGLKYVNAVVTDNREIVATKLYVDGMYYAEMYDINPAAPTIGWNTVNFSNGPHTLTARAYDSSRNVGVSQTITVNVLNQVSITSPMPGGTRRGVVPVVATVADGIVGVQFKIDGVNYGSEDTFPPFSVNWDTEDFADGGHTLVAVARLQTGSLVTSPSLTVYTDNTAPHPIFEHPLNNAIINHAVVLRARAEESYHDLETMNFYYDDILIGAPVAHGRPYPWTFYWNTDHIASGPHTLSVRVTDAVGNEGVASIQVTKGIDPSDSEPPVIYMTLPINGAVVSGFSTSLGAGAIDNVGVTHVEFWAQSPTLPATYLFSISSNSLDLQEPPGGSFFQAWNTSGFPNGTYSVYAKAYDEQGNVGVSPSLTVTVSNTVSGGQLRIAASEPYDGYIDPMEDQNPITGAPLGTTDVSLAFNGPVTNLGGTALTRDNFEVRFVRDGQTIPASSVDPAGLVTWDLVGTESPSGPYNLRFTPRIPPRAWTEIKVKNIKNYSGTQSGNSMRIVIAALPGDVDQDAVVQGADLARWMAIYDRSYPLQTRSRMSFINQRRDNGVDQNDIVRTIQLMHGIESSQSWNGARLGTRP